MGEAQQDIDDELLGWHLEERWDTQRYALSRVTLLGCWVPITRSIATLYDPDWLIRPLDEIRSTWLGRSSSCLLNVQDDK